MVNGLNGVLVSDCGGQANGGAQEATFSSKHQKMNVVGNLFRINADQRTQRTF